MTTLIVIDGHRPGGRRSIEVAKRFRSEIAAIGISVTEAARRCEKTQAWMSRRASARTAFDVDDLDYVCSRLGISYDFVATGIREVPTPTRGGDQVSESASVQSRQGAPTRPALRLVVTE